MPVEIGQVAPNFSLYSDAGETVTLQELRGSPVVLAFFPAAFTGVCEQELCTLRDSMAAFNDLGATVLGISVDSRFSNAAFAKQLGLEFSILSDYSRSTVDAYDIRFHDLAGMDGYDTANRAVFVLDSQGTVTWSWIADHPGNEPPYEEVKSAIAAL